ncbi:MAG TPA: NAD(P)H-binding protein [Marmoricola sp.]|nr:NAD(P)H-binding protein [Marmoricola sp.]
MSSERLSVLVTGATGFVGSRLVPALAEAGHRVRAMTRRPDRYRGPAEAVYGDVHDADSLRSALSGVEVAVYLVHSLGEADFERSDAEAARMFAAAAARAGVRQLVYLGGLGEEHERLSPHLRSRREVERLLAGTDVPLTVLRAAIVVGAGGISWELTRQLVKNLPAMVVPRWASTRTQPIAIDDVVRYLVGVVGNEAAYGRTFELGGADRLTYVAMLQQAAEELHGRPLPIIQVPVLTPRLSSYWIALVTDVDPTTARNLIDSMRNEVVQTDETIRTLVPGEPMGYREAVRRALAERRQA